MRSRTERGQVATTLVFTMIVGLLVVAVFGVFWLSRGVDERSQAQSAADAAALAGARAFEEALNGALPSLVSLIRRNDHGLAHLFGCDVGRAAASEYAKANDATLVDYCFHPDGRVTAQVRMDEPVREDLGPAEAGAVAHVGFDLTACSWHEADPPPPADPPEPPGGGPGGGPGVGPGGPPQPPPPPPDVPATLTCGPLVVEFLIGGADGVLKPVTWRFDPPEPRLVD